MFNIIIEYIICFYTKIISKSIIVYKLLVKLYKVNSQLEFIVHVKEA